MVTRPRLLRPPFSCLFSVSARSGLSVVISEKSATDLYRRAGVMGRNVFNGIVLLLDFFEERDGLPRLEGHNGALPVRTLARIAAQTLRLARNVHGAHLAHLDLEQRLHGTLDFDLVGVDCDLEE